MDDELKMISDFALFARVVQAGGISRCARRLGFERTTVSRRISNLEKRLGVTLLERTTHEINVTEAGRRCYEQSAAVIRAAKSACSAAVNAVHSVTDNSVVLGAPASAIDAFVSATVNDFEERNRATRVILRPVGRWTANTFDEVDIGLSIGNVDLPKTWSKPIAKIGQMIGASPSYLSNMTAIHLPRDLTRHTCISDSTDSSSGQWNLSRGGDSVRVAIGAKILVADALEAREAAVAGLGVVCLPEFMCRKLVETQQLIPILQGWLPLARDLVAISRQRASSKDIITLLRMYLDTAFRDRIL